MDRKGAYKDILQRQIIFLKKKDRICTSFRNIAVGYDILPTKHFVKGFGYKRGNTMVWSRAPDMWIYSQSNTE